MLSRMMLERVVLVDSITRCASALFSSCPSALPSFSPHRATPSRHRLGHVSNGLISGLIPYLNGIAFLLQLLSDELFEVRDVCP